MSEKTKRRGRFVRDKAAKRIELRDRDLAILQLVYEHRFVNSDQIRALLNGSGQKLTRRLNALFHNGYLDRPKAQLEIAGNIPMVYGLGNRGAEILARELDLSMPAVDWTTKNREVKNLFLEHTLLVSQIAVVLRLACRLAGNVEFISPQTIISKRPDGKLHLGWKVAVKKNISGLKRDINFRLFPDYAFGLRYKKDGKRKLAFFFVEADRATMPIKRSNFYRSSFYKKMVCYWGSWSQKKFSKAFGFERARIVTITSSPERIESLVAANKELDPRGQGLRIFLFAPEKLLKLEAPEKILAKYWLNGRGEADSLLA